MLHLGNFGWDNVAVRVLLPSDVVVVVVIVFGLIKLPSFPQNRVYLLPLLAC